MARKNYYVVTVGRHPGIYQDYALARAQTDRIGPAPKGFKTEAEAQDYWSQQMPVARDTTLAEVISKSFGNCWYCGVQLTNSLEHLGDGQIDHQTPRCQGGSNAFENLVLACRTCNCELKGGRNLEEFRQYMQVALREHGRIAFFGERIQVGRM